MDKYNYKKIEEKWQKKWEENKVFNASQNKKKKILCFRNVSLPIWKITYGPCPKLYTRRCYSKI